MVFRSVPFHLQRSQAGRGWLVVFVLFRFRFSQLTPRYAVITVNGCASGLFGQGKPLAQRANCKQEALCTKRLRLRGVALLLLARGSTLKLMVLNISLMFVLTCFYVTCNRVVFLTVRSFHFLFCLNQFIYYTWKHCNWICLI